MLLETTPPQGPLDWPFSFVQYGILGIILIMLLTEWLWPKPAVEQMQKQHLAEKEMWEARLLPVMERIAKGLEENNVVSRTQTNELSEVIRLLEDRRS